MDLHVLPQRRPEIAWRVIEGEAIVVNPLAGLAYPFNPVATRCWELADGRSTVSEIASVIAEEFDVPFEQAAQDVEGFISELHQKNMIELQSQTIQQGA